MPKPFNVGQLRKQLATEGLPWTVIDALDDRDMLSFHALGGSTQKLIPAAQAPALDLKQLLNVHSSNPLLNQRRAALGFLASPLWPLKPLRAELRDNVLPVPFAVAPAGGVVGAATPAGGTSRAVDWRTRWGTPWITTIQDQGGCESCWAFAVAALIESMVRIEHCVWSKVSEGDLHDGQGKKCADSFNMDATIQWAKANGVCDPDCWPYRQDNPNYTPTADRAGRSVRVPSYMWIGSVADQKTWLDTVGPIASWMDVWHDFDGYGGGVYQKVNTLPDGSANYERGGHFVLVVGYDDDQGCWICKNSWGTNWGEADWRGQHGYFRIKYGEVGIDDYSKLGVQYSNPDPWTKRRLHSGNLYESGDGPLHRNFEMVATAGSRLRHWWRNGGDFSWHAATTFGLGDAAVSPALTGTTYNRNFELIYLTTKQRLHHFWLDQTTGTWNDGGVFGPNDARGVPAFIQGNFGAPGNFEVVVRTADGRLAHWWRTNGPPWTWSESVRFGSNIAYSGPTLVQSNYGKKGNLELVAVRTDGRMQHFWRDDDASGLPWHQGVVFGSGVASIPVMIQGQYGCGDERAIGNFELCVAVGGAIQHWWRDNSGGTGWHMSALFGHDVSAVIGLVEGSFGFNLEVVALRRDEQLQHYWRDGAGWHEGPVIGNIFA